MHLGIIDFHAMHGICMGHPDLHFSSFQTIPIGHSYAKVNVELKKNMAIDFFTRARHVFW